MTIFYATFCSFTCSRKWHNIHRKLLGTSSWQLRAIMHASYIYNIIIIKHILYIDRWNKMGRERGGMVLNLKMVGEGHLCILKVSVIVHEVSSSLMAHMTRASLLTF